MAKNEIVIGSENLGDAASYNPFSDPSYPQVRSMPTGSYAGPAMPTSDEMAAGPSMDQTVPQVDVAGGTSNTPSAPLPTYEDSGYRPGGEQRQSPGVAGTAPAKAPGFALSSITPTWTSIGGVRAVNLGVGLDLDVENTDYTLQQTRGTDGTVVSKVVEAPENAKELGMSLIKKYDPETGNATYGKPETPEDSVAQSLYKSPQFMAPVTASVVNGLFQMLIAERMAKAQRDEQRRMLDAQFQVLEKKEEANEEKKRRFASIYASLQAERKGKGRSG